MQAPSERQNKVSRLIQKDLGELFNAYARNLSGGVLISVASVRVSSDLSFAKCHLSVFPSKHAEQVLEKVNSDVKEIRYKLGTKVRNQLRKVPELAFFIDDSLDYIDKIGNLLNK